MRGWCWCLWWWWWLCVAVLVGARVGVCTLIWPHICIVRLLLLRMYIWWWWWFFRTGSNLQLLALLLLLLLLLLQETHLLHFESLLRMQKESFLMFRLDEILHLLVVLMYDRRNHFQTRPIIVLRHKLESTMQQRLVKLLRMHPVAQPFGRCRHSIAEHVGQRIRVSRTDNLINRTILVEATILHRRHFPKRGKQERVMRLVHILVHFQFELLHLFVVRRGRKRITTFVQKR
mmetsp:Transcript_26470/g.43259  ORF Transcript_26470/g.43259 Transcript_26470/m.43259 type:complete len:232 (+) Transcript_26470:602-1297(+)